MSDDRAPRAQTVSLVVIACVVGAAGLYYARDVLLPMAFAALLSVALRPIVRRMERWRLPSYVGATVVVLALIFAVAAAGFALAGPTQRFVDSAPQRLADARARIESLRRPVQQATELAARIEGATSGEDPTRRRARPGVTAEPQAPAAVARLFGTTTALLSAVVEVLLLLFLLLATGDLFLRKLVKLLPMLHDKTEAVRTVSEVEAAVLRYLLATLLINVVQGAIVGVVMLLLGMPAWWLWGLMTMVIEFVPYLGAAVMVALLTVVALATFNTVGHALAAPASYLLITTVQNNVVSPYAYGTRLKLNPVAVLVGVILWGSLWGVGGAFIAVPLVAGVKILSDHVEGLKPLGEFLGE